MSKNSVPPPAANARLPVAAPSHSVRPGSLKCRCTSIRPGSTARPRASISSRARRQSRRRSSTIRPSSTATSARRSPSGNDHRAAAHDEISHECVLASSSRNARPAASAAAYIVLVDGLVGMMADAAGTAEEEHGGGHACREDHGIVTGAARHACTQDAPACADSAGERGHEPGVHRHCRLIEPRFPADRQPPPRRDLPRRVMQPDARGDAHPVVGMSDVETRAALAGDDVGCAGLSLRCAPPSPRGRVCPAPPARRGRSIRRRRPARPGAHASASCPRGSARP